MTNWTALPRYGGVNDDANSATTTRGPNSEQHNEARWPQRRYENPEEEVVDPKSGLRDKPRTRIAQPQHGGLDDGGPDDSTNSTATTRWAQEWHQNPDDDSVGPTTVAEWQHVGLNSNTAGSTTIWWA